MRKLIPVAALLACLVVPSVSHAQVRRSQIFGNVNPNDIKFTPIDTNNALRIPIPSQQNGFSLKNFFNRFSLTNMFSKPKVGVSPFPSPSSFPSTYYQSPIQPMAPFYPNK
jgi:hypothetical protein